jgi:lysophospholipase L1-like esterase
VIKIFLAAVLLASTADAQTIAGAVRAHDCSLLPGAEVVLKGDATERRVITDTSGAFAFRDLAEPRYGIRVTLVGFYSFSREDVLPIDPASSRLVIGLPLGQLSFEEHAMRRYPPVSDSDGGRILVQDQDCRPFEGAAVEFQGPTSMKARSDVDGFVLFPLTLAGEYSIRVAAAGVIPATVPAVRLPFRFRDTLIVALRRGSSNTPDVLESRQAARTEMRSVNTLPPAAVRIVAMGDSTTAGTPAFQSPREAPPAGHGDETSQYAYWLMKTHADWQVINQGINGQRSDEIRARFEEDVVARKPAVVVIIAGVNDVYQGRQVQHVKDELAAMYRRSRNAGIRVVAGTIIPYDTATPEQNARMHEINDWIREQARGDSGVIFADTRAAVAARGQPDRLAGSPDGLHPDAAGYRRMADVIGPAVERALHPTRSRLQ